MAFPSGAIVKNLVAVEGTVQPYDPSRNPEGGPRGQSGAPGAQWNESVEIPPNHTGEVLASDELFTTTIYPIHTTGRLEPMLVKVEDFTAHFKRVVRHNPFRMPGKTDPAKPKTGALSEYKIHVTPTGSRRTGQVIFFGTGQEDGTPIGKVKWVAAPMTDPDQGTWISYLGYVDENGEEQYGDLLGFDRYPQWMQEKFQEGKLKNEELRAKYPNLAKDMLFWVRDNLTPPFRAEVQNPRLQKFLDKLPRSTWAYSPQARVSSDEVARAREFAIERHAGQMYGPEPYVYHLDLVKGVLDRFGYTDPELLQAAYLHDVIEDTPTTREEVAEVFGPRVATLAWAVTDEPGANRKERKLNTYPKIKATPGATAIKLADRIANTENPNGMKNDMYRKEQPAFREALYTGEYQEMWDHLDTILGNSGKTKTADHDYHPSWDYEVIEGETNLDALLAEVMPEFLRVAEREGFEEPEVYWVTGLNNEVARYIDGTSSRPVIVVSADTFDHLGPGSKKELSKTLLHELRHAIQERNEEVYNEDDAEGWTAKVGAHGYMYHVTSAGRRQADPWVPDRDHESQREMDQEFWRELGQPRFQAGIGKPEDFDYERPDDWLLGLPPEGEVWVWNPATGQYEPQQKTASLSEYDIREGRDGPVRYPSVTFLNPESGEPIGLIEYKERERGGTKIQYLGYADPSSGFIDYAVSPTDRERNAEIAKNFPNLARDMLAWVRDNLKPPYEAYMVNNKLKKMLEKAAPDLVQLTGTWRESSSNYRKEVQELLRECERQGLQVKRTKKNHFLVTKPGHRESVLIASSPSIASSIKDSIGHLRRNFGFQWQRRGSVKQAHWMRGFKAILLHPKEGIAIGQTEFDEHQGLANREFLDKDAYRNSYRGLYNPQTQQLVHMTGPGYRETVTKDVESAKRARPIWEKAMREWKLPIREYGMMMLSRDPGGHRFVALPEDKKPYKPVTWNPMPMRVPEGDRWMTANVHDDLHDRLLEIFHRTLPQPEDPEVSKIANLSEYFIQNEPHSGGYTDIWFNDPETGEHLGNIQYHPNQVYGGTYIDYLGYVTEEGEDVIGDNEWDNYNESRRNEVRMRFPNLGRDMLSWVKENLEPPYTATVQNPKLDKLLDKVNDFKRFAYKLPGNWLAVLYEEDNGILEVALDTNETHDDVARKISERMILDGEDRDYADPQAVYNRSWRGLYNPDLSAFAHDAVPGDLGDDDWTDNFYRDEWLGFIGDRLSIEKFGKFIQEMVPGRGERRRVKWYESPEEQQQRSIERELAETKYEEERRRRREQLGIVDGI